jgi:ketosteroid isomerase-like protein
MSTPTDRLSNSQANPQALTIALCASFALVACRHADGAAGDTLRASAAGHDQVRRALLAADAKLAASIAERGEAEGLWPLLAEDGVYLYPGVEVVSGRSAVRDFLRETLPAASAPRKTLHVVTGDASSDGTIGYSFGWFESAGDVGAAAGAAGAGADPFGKYLAAWRREGDAWQIAAFVRISAPRAPSPAPTGAAILAGEHGVAQPGDPEALREQVLAADRAFAARSVAEGYTVAFTSYCAPDAVIAGGREFFWNAAGVAEAHAGWTPGDTLDWAPRLGRAAASGDLGYSVGDAVHRAPGKPTTASKYLTIWIRRGDGSWRFVLDGGNARPAPAP